MLACRRPQHGAWVAGPGGVSGGDRQRPRSSARRRHYGLALDVLDRHAVPLTADELALVTDVPTQTQHLAVVALVTELRRRGIPVPNLSIHQGIVQAGPLTYVHPRSRRGRAERPAAIH